MPSGIERILTAFRVTSPAGFDFKALVDDEQYWANADDFFHPDAVTRFITPDGGFVGPLAGPFRGPEGFRAGWREWLRAWDTYLARVDHARESEDGRHVLLLVTSRGTVAGTQTVVDQPSAALYELEGGRIASVDHYLDHEQARREFEERAGDGT